MNFYKYGFWQIDTRLISTIYNGGTSELYQKLLSITKELNLKGKTDIEKVEAIHDYLVLNTKYAEEIYYRGNEGENTSFEVEHYAEGTLNKNLAVCSGYASTFRLLLMLQGIPCEYVWSDEGNHAWNLVQVDGKWYHVDVTWDDPIPDREGRVLYTYFMMTDSEIAQTSNHQNWRCECRHPDSHNCDDNTYSIAYSIVVDPKNHVCTTKEEVMQVIQAQATNNTIFVTWSVESELIEDDVKDLAKKILGVNIGCITSSNHSKCITLITTFSAR